MNYAGAKSGVIPKSLKVTCDHLNASISSI